MNVSFVKVSISSCTHGLKWVQKTENGIPELQMIYGTMHAFAGFLLQEAGFPNCLILSSIGVHSLVTSLYITNISILLVAFLLFDLLSM